MFSFRSFAFLAAVCALDAQPLELHSTKPHGEWLAGPLLRRAVPTQPSTQPTAPVASSNDARANVHHDFGNHGSPAACSNIMFDWFKKYFQTTSASKISILDVGGGSGDKTVTLQGMDTRVHAECVDVIPSKMCKQYPGNALTQYKDKSEDVVLFAYMFHHAANDSIPLLHEAKRVAHKIVIVEDLKGDNPKNLNEQAHHGGCKPPGCIFRTSQEWEGIFKTMGFKIVNSGDPGYYCMAPSYNIPRGFWVLQADSQ